MPANTSRGYTYPLYTDVNDFPAQMQDFALDVDLDVFVRQSNINAVLNAPTGKVTGNVPILVAPNTTVTVTWDTESYDNAAMVDLGVSNTLITIVDAGIYLITCMVKHDFNADATTNGRYLDIVAGGLGSMAAQHTTRALPTIDSELSATTLVELAVGNTVSARVRQNSGSNLNVTTRRMSVTKISAS